MRLAISLFLLAFSALAADVDGKWTSQLPGRDGQNQELIFTFKAEGSKLTGNVATPWGTLDVAGGKIDGDKISFTVVAGGDTILVTGKVSGNEIQFERKREGSDQSQQFIAKKQS